MKRLLSLFVFTFCALHLAFGALAAQAETIKNFDVQASLDADRMLDVTETINYDFGDGYRHGIYRLIPETYQRNGANYRLRLDVIGATIDGAPVQSDVTSESGNIRIRLGDPDRTITGAHVYTIHYTTNRAINDFPSDHEAELYWNITGNGWEVPIGETSFTLTGPSAAAKTVCYTGVFGSTEQNCSIVSSGSTVTVKTGPLDVYEGLTFAVRYPDTAIHALPLSTVISEFIRDNIWLFFPVIVFAVMFSIWWKNGRDPAGRGTVIPLYEEPRKLSPLELSAIRDEDIPSRAISATLVDLARRGYAKMKFDGDNIFYVRAKAGDDQLKDFEKTLLEGVFAKGDEVDLADKNTLFYKSVAFARGQGFTALKQQGFYQNSPAAVRTLWVGIAVAVGFFCFYVVAGFSFLYMLSGLISALIIALFGWQMPKVTREGAIVREEIEGFKRFLSVTETKRLEFSDAPAKKPEQFARFLPAAVAFGVEKQWAGQFANMQLPQPDYMQGNMNGWTAYNIASAVDRFHDKSVSHLYAPPSSAGSGGSGFSGGGSGGGFGGGGGGSW